MALNISPLKLLLSFIFPPAALIIGIKDKGQEKYKELKNNFDARRIMGELNCIIDVINDYCEKIEYLQEALKATPIQILQQFNEMNKKTKLLKTTKKELDNCIKGEWDPRIRILGEDFLNFYSDKELRDAHSQFVFADREIQKLTKEREIFQKIDQTLKVAGIGVVAVTGLTLGTLGAANRAADRQSFRDHFGA